MATKTEAKKITDDAIIAMYMEYVLEHEMVPKSIFKFCKSNKIKEEDFYAHFGSVETLQHRIWEKFYENTQKLMNDNKEYASFSNKDKMLTFFFSMFELLTMNRSYVLFALRDHKNMLRDSGQLKGLRHNIKDFATVLINEANQAKNYKLTKRNPTIFSEGAWIQFLFLLKFWMEDASAGFEKTDVVIEKSVTTIFDVFENTPLDSLLDFGKFLYKEKMA